MPGQPQPVGQVHVLVDHEEVLVEAADFVEGFPADDEGRAADPEHLTGLEKRGDVGAVATFIRPTRPQISVAGTVHRGRVVQEDDARGRQ